MEKPYDNLSNTKENTFSPHMQVQHIDLEKLLNDLKIQQIELKQQQDEIQRIRLELEQTKDEFADLFDFATTSYFTLNKNGRIIFLNLAGARLLQKDRETMIKQSFLPFISPAFRKYFGGLVRKSFKTMENQSGEMLLRTASGDEINVAIALLCIENNHGKKDRVRISMKDLTRKREQDDLIEISQAKLRALLDSSAQAIFLLGPDFELLKFNQIAFNQTRLFLSKKLNEGESMLNFVAASDKDTFIINFNNALKGIPTIKEKQITIPGNKPNWTELRYMPMYNNPGEIIGVAFSILDISERKNAQNELEPVKEQARLLLGLIPNAIFTVDSNKIITSWNKRAGEITGYKPAEVIGKSCHKLNIDTCKNGCALFPRHNNKSVYGSECTITNKSGKERIIIKNFAVVRNSDGQIIEGIESFEDVTDKRQSELLERIKTQRIIRYQKTLLSLSKKHDHTLESDLKRILSSAAAALSSERVSFWLISDDWQLLNCSSIYTLSSKKFSHGSLSLKMANAPAYFKAIQNDRLICARDVLTDKRTMEFADHYALPLGITSLIDVPVRIKGQLVGVLCNEHTGPMRNWTIEDQEFATSIADMVAIALIAEKNNLTEKRLRKSEVLYHKLISASPDAITLLDAKGKISFASSTTVKMFGYQDTQELLGRYFWNFVHPEEYERLRKNKTLTGELHSFPEMQFKFIRKDKTTFYGEINSAIITDNLDKPVSLLTITRDISDRKNAEEQLIQSEHQLREANATKDKFFSIIAHDLKSPFSSLIGFSELLYEEYNQFDEQEIKEFIQQIYISSTNSLKLLDNLLQWAKSQTGRIVASPEYLNVNNLVFETIGLLKAASNNKKIKLRTDLQDGCVVLADRYMTLTILRNLLSNAIKFTYPGGDIIISSVKVKDKIRISVADNGTGISPSDQEKLFRVDQKVRNPGTNNEYGTGLGLILCKEFVEKNAGVIGVESKEGIGSVFYFLFPGTG